MSNNFFNNIYDPTVEDIQKVFPDYHPLTREQWKSEYNNHLRNLSIAKKNLQSNLIAIHVND